MKRSFWRWSSKDGWWKECKILLQRYKKLYFGLAKIFNKYPFKNVFFMIIHTDYPLFSNNPQVFKGMGTDGRFFLPFLQRRKFWWLPDWSHVCKALQEKVRSNRNKQKEILSSQSGLQSTRDAKIFFTSTCICKWTQSLELLEQNFPLLFINSIYM